MPTSVRSSDRNSSPSLSWHPEFCESVSKLLFKISFWMFYSILSWKWKSASKFSKFSVSVLWVSFTEKLWKMLGYENKLEATWFSSKNSFIFWLLWGSGFISSAFCAGGGRHGLATKLSAASCYYSGMPPSSPWMNWHLLP